MAFLDIIVDYQNNKDLIRYLDEKGFKRAFHAFWRGIMEIGETFAPNDKDQ